MSKANEKLCLVWVSWLECWPMHGRACTWVAGGILGQVGAHVGGTQSMCVSHIHVSLFLSPSFPPFHSL